MKKHIRRKLKSSQNMDGASDYKQIKDKTIEILHEVASIDMKDLDYTAPWYELDAESYELVEFIVALRDEFEVSITTRDLIKMKNLKDIIEYIYKIKKIG